MAGGFLRLSFPRLDIDGELTRLKGNPERQLTGIFILSRRIVQTFWAWFFILVIAFRFIPNRVITRPVAAIWVPLVERPWFALGYNFRLAIGALALLGLVFGSGYGFPLRDVRYFLPSSFVCGELTLDVAIEGKHIRRPDHFYYWFVRIPAGILHLLL